MYSGHESFIVDSLNDPRSLYGHSDIIRSCGMSADGLTIVSAAANDSAVWVWDLSPSDADNRRAQVNAETALTVQETVETGSVLKDPKPEPEPEADGWTDPEWICSSTRPSRS